MELINPWAIYIGLGLVLLVFIVSFFLKDKYKKGRKTANTDILKEMPEYKRLLRIYGLYKVIVIVAIIIAILACSVIISRPVEVQMDTIEISNRDIYICLDISTSMDELNLELLDELNGFIDDLHGERIGLTIFNAKTVILVPLTTDYEYLKDTVDTLHSSIEQNQYAVYTSDVSSMELYEYQFGGTLSEHGSSLIGDGLATTLYCFNDLHENEDRSRLIVFLTDNDLMGEPIVTVSEACDLCSANNVKVFALSPSFVVDESNFENAIESTGGEYFNYRKKHALRDLLEAVERTDKSPVTITTTSVTEYPEVPIVLLTLCMAVYVFAGWRTKI